MAREKNPVYTLDIPALASRSVPADRSQAFAANRVEVAQVNQRLLSQHLVSVAIQTRARHGAIHL